MGTAKLPQSSQAASTIQAKEAAAASLGGFSQPNPNAVQGSSGQFQAQHAASSPGVQLKVDASSSSVVQMHGGGGGNADVHATAASAFQGGGGALPHKSAIESSFGADMSSVQAFTGPAASKACESLGAQAFASGNKVAFKDSGPSVQLAAHEAAHVVQQSQGVSLSGGVGKAGDKYEVAADSAAARVVQNQSAGDILGTAGKGGGDGVQTKLQLKQDNVQLLGTPLSEDLPEGAATPEHGSTPGKQRKYSVEQYVEMWEKEQGRAMTAGERKTLARGCIGITALNISGGGNPPLNNVYASFDQAKKLVDDWNKFIDEHRGEVIDGKKISGQAILFAKLFWSNQSPDPEERKKPDKDAYLPDEDGKVDMTDYEYRAQPTYINFDYGFWDNQTQCFWHANHCEPGMVVYQSTKDKFAAGYIDFDRIVYGVAIASNYNPAAAALGG